MIITGITCSSKTHKKYIQHKSVSLININPTNGVFP